MLHRLKNRWAAMFAGVVIWAVPVWGHHSFAAEFDSTKPITVTGVVTKLEWVNPHAYICLDAKDASGAIEHWEFQTVPPGMLRARGVTREMFPVGQTVTIFGFASKDGTKTLGWIKKIQYPDGRVLQVTAEEEKKEEEKK